VKTVNAVDFAVIALYMALMLGIGFYAARFNRGASDYFKGGNRIPWLVAGLSSFMSGFSAWTMENSHELAPIGAREIEDRAAALGTWSSFNLLWVK